MFDIILHVMSVAGAHVNVKHEHSEGNFTGKICKGYLKFYLESSPFHDFDVDDVKSIEVIEAGRRNTAIYITLH